MDITSYMLGKKNGGGQPSEDIGDYFTTTLVAGTGNTPGIVKSLKKIPDNMSVASGTTSLQALFVNCSSIDNIPLFDTTGVENMIGMFQGCTNLTTIPKFNTSSVTKMNYMFWGCTNLTTIPKLDTSKVTIMATMFQNCTNLTAIPQLDTSKVTAMDSMFTNCTNLTTIPVLNTSSATNMQHMFQNCPNLTDDSLNNILAMCIGATSYTGPKTLMALNISTVDYRASRIQALSNYQAFLDAGWTIS